MRIQHSPISPPGIGPQFAAFGNSHKRLMRGNFQECASGAAEAAKSRYFTLPQMGDSQRASMFMVVCVVRPFITMSVVCVPE